MDGVPFLNGDSGKSHLIQSSTLSSHNVENVQENSYVDLDTYIESNPLTDTSTVGHHKFTIIIGGLVLLVSVIVTVVALTAITVGIAQSIVLALSLEGVMLGGAFFLKSFVGIIYNKLCSRDQDSYISKNARSALAIGLGLTIFGFLSKLVPVTSDLGDYGQILDRIGSTAYNMGTFSIFNALIQLVYSKLFLKNVEINIDESSKSEESKKQVMTSLLTLTIGVGLAILGISLLITGSLVLVGTGQVLAFAFAVPLLAPGISLIVKNVMNFPWTSFKELLLNKLSEKDQKDLFSNILYNQEKFKKALLNESDPVNLKVSDTKNVFFKFSLESRLALLFSIFFLLLSLTLVLTSVFLSGPILQVKLLSIVGGVILSTSLPSVVSGISALAMHIRNKFKGFNKVKVRNKKIIEDVRFFDLENEDKLVDLEKIISQQKILEQKFETKVLVILGSLSVLLGIGFVLLSLIPGSFSIMGVVSIGSPFLIVGGLILIDKIIILLREKLRRIIKKRENRKKRVSYLPSFLREAIENG